MAAIPQYVPDPVITHTCDGQFAHTFHGVTVIGPSSHTYAYNGFIDHLLGSGLVSDGDTVTITDVVHHEPSEPLLQPGDWAYGESFYTISGDNLEPTEVLYHSFYHY